LIFALILAGVAGLGTIALGWWLMGWQHQTGWSRLSDGGWWGGTAAHLLGYLALGKVGFKVALGVVFAGVAFSAWLRGRHKESGGDPADGQIDASEPSR
jgi:hypothetical protein